MIISSKIFTYTLESHNLWISNLWLVPWFGQISQLIRLCSVRLLLISCKDLSKYIEMVWRCFSAQLLAPVLALVAPSESKIGPRILSKNILGTFYLPQLVFCISETFLTLILGIGWAFFFKCSVTMLATNKSGPCQKDPNGTFHLMFAFFKWLVGGLEHFLFSIIYRIYNPSHWLIFFKMVKTTNQMGTLLNLGPLFTKLSLPVPSAPGPSAAFMPPWARRARRALDEGSCDFWFPRGSRGT